MLKTIIEKSKRKEGFSKEENDYLYGLLEKMDSEEDKKEIRELLVQGNIGLAVQILQQMSYPVYLREDMVQEAIYALIKAVNHFDIGKHVAFSSFAATVIRNHLRDCRRDYDKTIVIPYRVYRNAKLSKDKEKYMHVIEQSKTLYIDEIEPGYLAIDFDPDDHLIRDEEISALKKAIERLPEEDQALLFDRYLNDNLTYQKIAQKHHKSMSYVYRRLKELCGILQEWMEEGDNNV